MTLTAAVWNISRAQDEIIAWMLYPTTPEEQLTTFVRALICLGMAGRLTVMAMRGETDVRAS
jgi:hypothetical protein